MLRDVLFPPSYLTVLVALLLPGCLATTPHAAVSTNHPAAADVPPGEVRLRQIHPDVWVHVSTWRFGDGSVYPMNGLVVRDSAGMLLIDPAWGEDATTALLAAVDAEIGEPVRRAIVTHFHDDRVSGAGVLERHGVTVFGTPHTRRLAAAEGNVVPADSLTGLNEIGSTVSVGPVDVYFPGAGHTLDNLVVYVREAAVLFGGCAVHESSRETAGNVEDADLRSWPDAIRRVRTRYPEAEIVVPGHGRPGGPELLEHTIDVVEAHRGCTSGG